MTRVSFGLNICPGSWSWVLWQPTRGKDALSLWQGSSKSWMLMCDIILLKANEPFWIFFLNLSICFHFFVSKMIRRYIFNFYMSINKPVWNAISSIISYLLSTLLEVVSNVGFAIWLVGTNNEIVRILLNLTDAKHFLTCNISLNVIFLLFGYISDLP